MPKWNLEVSPDHDDEDETAVAAALGLALERFGMLPPDFRRRVDAAARVYAAHEKRDKPFLIEFSKRISLALNQLNGKDKQPCEYLTLLGSSGSGKSRMVRNALARSGLDDPIELTGRTLRPVIRIQGPRPFTTGQLAVSILKEVGMPTDTHLAANHAWQMVRNHLPLSKTALIIIDEAQHALWHKDPAFTIEVRDAIKILAEDKDWPVGFIFVGIPVFERFITTDNQVIGRNLTIRMPSLNVNSKGDEKYLHALLAKMMSAAELSMDDGGDEEFYRRLMCAGGQQLGRCQKLIRLAIEQALTGLRSTVVIEDFAEALRQRTGCDDDHNWFLASEYQVIPHWLKDAELESYVAADDILVIDDKRPKKKKVRAA